MNKKGLFLTLSALFIAGLFLFGGTKDAKTALKPYYSGDATFYNGNLMVVSANTGRIELFKLENANLARLADLRAGSGQDSAVFSDAKLKIENGRLFIYATSGFSIYKYDVSDTNSVRLEKQIKNSYWEWYTRMDSFGDYLLTFSDRGLKVWNSNLEAVDSYDFKPNNDYSVNSDGGPFVFAYNGSNLEIYNRISRTILKSIPLSFNTSKNNRRSYYDSSRGEIYVVDDSYTRKLSFEGASLNSFRHLDQPGYDVSSYNNSEFIYFSNGVGVVKLRKDNFKLSTYAFTSNLGGSGGWAMGLKVVDDAQQGKVVVFNGANILVLDHNLKKIATRKAEEENTSQTPQENVFLYLDHNIGAAGANVNLSGGGFWARENVKIDFGGNKYIATTDWQGRFTQTIAVPNIPAAFIDIKTEGQNSGIHYNISFKIQ